MKRTVLTEAEAAEVAEVFQQFRPLVEQVARRHCGHQQDVADIVQTVGMKLCTSLQGFRGRAHIKTWLYRVTVNAARDHHAAQVRQMDRPREKLGHLSGLDEAENFMAEPVGCPDRAARAGERLAALRDAVAKLTPLQQDAIGDEMVGRAVYTDKAKARYRARQRVRVLLATDPRVFD